MLLNRLAREQNFEVRDSSIILKINYIFESYVNLYHSTHKSCRSVILKPFECHSDLILKVSEIFNQFLSALLRFWVLEFHLSQLMELLACFCLQKGITDSVSFSSSLNNSFLSQFVISDDTFHHTDSLY